MCIQSRGHRYSLASLLSLTVACAMSACGSDDGSSSRSSAGEGGAADVTGGADVAGGSNATMAEAGGGGVGSAAGGALGVGGSEEQDGCLLDAGARERTESLLMQVVAQASWITTQTHGVGQFAGRGFGFGVPFTTSAALSSGTLMAACEGENTFDEYCSPPEAATLVSCSQMKCLAAGVLEITTHIDGLPTSLPAEPPPGDVQLRHASQVATFTDQTVGVAIAWTTDIELVMPDDETLALHETATAVADDPDNEQTRGSISIEGLSSVPLEATYEVEAGTLTGQGTVSDAPILEMTYDGVTWLGSCALP